MSNTPPSRERMLLFTTFAIGLGSSIALSFPFPPGEINAFVIRAIPLPVASIFMLMPFLMRYGLSISEQEQEIEEQEQLKRAEEKRRGKVRFHCDFSADEHGTQWFVANRNVFDWGNTYLLIERSCEGMKESDKISLGRIRRGQQIMVESHLVDMSTAKWRVMVICPQGQSLDFPSQKKASPWLAASKL